MHILLLPLLCLLSIAPQSGTGPTPDEAEEASKRRLGRIFSLEAARLCTTDEALLVPEEIDLALLAAREGAALQPDDLEAWRIVLEIADLAGDQDAVAEAVDRLVGLDPQNEQFQLRRVMTALDRRSTVEERVDGFMRLLDPDRRAEIPGPFASRLAYELAVLLHRAGDRDGFLEWLREAIALDPFNPVAAERAVEVFGPSAEPDRLGELLVARCLANPARFEWLDQLATYALEHGAYDAASRLLDLILTMTGGAARAPDGYVVARILAAWGANDLETAELLLDTRLRHQVGELDRIRGWLRDYPEWAVELPTEGERLRARSVRVEYLAARADILDSRLNLLALKLLFLQQGGSAGTEGLSDEARTAVQMEKLATLEEFTQVVQITVLYIKEHLAETRSLREARSSAAVGSVDGEFEPEELRAASMRYILATEVLLAFDEVPLEIIDPISSRMTDPYELSGGEEDVDAPNRVTIPEQEAARLAGWRALRDARSEDAIEAFRSLGDADHRALLGLASAYIRADDPGDAARTLLALARNFPARATGVVARRQLATLLNSELPVSDQARRLDEIVAAIPSSYDRLLVETGRAVPVRVRALATDLSPIDPIEVEVELTNNTSLPLSLDGGGPIRPILAMPADVTVVGLGYQNLLGRAMLVPLSGPIQIAPLSTVTTRVDLSRAPVEPRSVTFFGLSKLSFLEPAILLGTRAIVNPIASPTAAIGFMEPGLLGNQSSRASIRIEGVASIWNDLDPLLDSLNSPSGPSFDDVTAAGLILDGISRIAIEEARLVTIIQQTNDEQVRRDNQDTLTRLLESFPGERRVRFSEGLEDAYSRLSSYDRAWLLMMLTPDVTTLALRTTEPLKWLALRRPGDRLVQMAAMLRLGNAPNPETMSPVDDPLVLELLRSSDEAVRRMAELRQAISAEQLRRTTAR